MKKRKIKKLEKKMTRIKIQLKALEKAYEELIKRICTSKNSSS